MMFYPRLVNGRLAMAGGYMSGTNGSSSVGADGSSNNLTLSSDGHLTFSDKALPHKGDLNVLVTLVYPNDKRIVDKLKKKTTRDTIQGNIDLAWKNVATYYDQASYGKLKIKRKVSDFYQLSGEAKDYVIFDKDNTNVSQDKNVQERLLCEAVGLVSGDHDLNHFDVMACVFYMDVEDGNPSIRGCGDLTMKDFSYDNGGLRVDIQLRSPIYLLIVDETASWGRCAHELGHCLIVAPTLPEGELESEPQEEEDLYAFGGLDSPAACFDLMGDHDSEPLFSGYLMEQLQFYTGDEDANGEKDILEIDWSGFKDNGEYLVAAHGLKENGEDKPGKNVYHLLKVKVSPGLSYYVEVRQQGEYDSPQVFDGAIPNEPILDGLSDGDDLGFDDVAANEGGVVVTQVLTNKEMDSNQEKRFINLLDYECGYGDAPAYPTSAVLKKGAKAIDLARGLTIEVLEARRSRPLVYNVRISRDNDINDIDQPNDPTVTAPGRDDLWIMQGDEAGEAPWESPDIWVEREPFDGKNHKWDYDWDIANDKPNYSGDRPVAGKRHRIWARVNWSGKKKAKNVVVGFYAVSPPHIGYDGNWSSELGHSTGNVPAEGYQDFVAPVEWVPEYNNLTCIVACVEGMDGDSDLSDNEAKEMVFDMDLMVPDISEMLDPIPLDVVVKNPLDKDAVVYLTYEADPGFNVQLPVKLNIKAGKSTTVKMTIVPTDSYDAYLKRDKRYSRIGVTGFVDDASSISAVRCYPADGSGPIMGTPIDGVTYWVGLKTMASISLKVDGNITNRTVKLKGGIDPPTGKADKVHVDLYDGAGNLRDSIKKTTGTQGGFSVKFINLNKGHYKASAILDNSTVASCRGSGDVEFDV